MIVIWRRQLKAALDCQNRILIPIGFVQTWVTIRKFLRILWLEILVCHWLMIMDWLILKRDLLWIWRKWLVSFNSFKALKNWINLWLIILDILLDLRQFLVLKAFFSQCLIWKMLFLFRLLPLVALLLSLWIVFNSHRCDMIILCANFMSTRKFLGPIMIRLNM